MLKVKDLLSLGADELKDKATKMKKELMQLRFQSMTGKLERQTAMRETKRDIARILTVIHQKNREKSK
ncbi:MAG: 50S ribosomal protein L29 [Omnitrophica bacterium GWA2_52_8]|nr:MAG: 50S ribosomal protein L29 [Omnitrophica bacterium GWA2_52_8]